MFRIAQSHIITYVTYVSVILGSPIWAVALIVVLQTMTWICHYIKFKLQFLLYGGPSSTVHLPSALSLTSFLTFRDM